MYTLKIGTFVLNGQIVLYLLFALAGWLSLRYRPREEPRKNDLLALFVQSFWIWLFVWKGSFALFDPASVVRHPSSLLYFDGGLRGRWVAGIITAAYALYRVRKTGLPYRLFGEGIAAYMPAGLAAYALGSLLMGGEPVALLGMQAFAAALLAAFVLLSPRPFRKDQLAAAGLRAFIGCVLAAMLVYGIYDFYADRKRDTASEQTGDSGPRTGVRKGELAPDFEMVDTAGNPVRLSDFRGQRVLINFWATWCPPCRAEMPQIQKFYEKRRNDGIVVLAVNLTSTERSPEAVGSFTNQHGLTFPVLLDRKGDVMKTYQVRAYPTSYIVDQDGIVREKFQGAVNEDMIRQAMDKIRSSK